MVLCMGFAHGFRHDDFLPMVFCRIGIGNYDYVLIQVYGLGFMNVSSCIYMYCNIERNIIKNKSGSIRFGIQGKISVYIFLCSHHFIFSCYKNLSVAHFCARIKPTFGIRVVLDSRVLLCSSLW